MKLKKGRVMKNRMRIPVLGAVLLWSAIASAYSYDVDGNGVLDSNLYLQTCSTDSTEWCMVAVSSLTGVSGEIRITPKLHPANTTPWVPTSISYFTDSPGLTTSTCATSYNYDLKEFSQRALIGKHVGMLQNLSQVVYLPSSCNVDAAGPHYEFKPELLVFDLQAHTIIASVTGPVEQTSYFYSPSGATQGGWQNPAFVGYVHDAGGLAHPFMAPGYGDMDIGGGGSVWGYMCRFTAGAPSNGACGPNFTTTATIPSPGFFAEGGGYIADLDGDGAEDLTLTFHSWVLTQAWHADGTTPSYSTNYNVSATTILASANPSSPIYYFHAGRNYGTHATLPTSSDGLNRTVMVGGNAVGTFSDPYCNVSRWVGVLSNAPTDLAHRTLAWSYYEGFHSSTFTGSSGLVSTIARQGDMQNGCVHRFSTGASVMDGNDIIIYNYFTQPHTTQCQYEQGQLYATNWSAAAYSVWSSCIVTEAAINAGRWGMRVRDQRTGGVLTGSLDTYVWGQSNRLVPSGETVYLVEPLTAGGTHFDFSSESHHALEIRALVGGRWATRGILPSATRPALTWATPANVGLSVAADMELTLQDRDGDGLLDVQLTDGTWAGYSTAAGMFVTKP